MPSYDVAPILKRETLQKYPFLKELLDKLSSSITLKEIREMNLIIDQNAKSEKEVAKNFLIEKGLL